MYLEWIKKGLEKPGKTRVGLAKALRVHPSAVTRLLDGKRMLRADELPTVADYLGIAAPTGPDEPEEPPPQPMEVVSIPVRGEAAAGNWREARTFEGFAEADEDTPTIPVLPDARYRHLPHFAVRISGPSINRRIPDGDYAICVPYWSARTKKINGDLVLVERRRKNGEIEATVKRLVAVGSDFELRPESTDARYSHPVRLTDGHDLEEPEIEVEIIGLVVGRYGAL